MATRDYEPYPKEVATKQKIVHITVGQMEQKNHA
jgi:hypothetical protein